MSNLTLPRLIGALFAGSLALSTVAAPIAVFAADPAPGDTQPADAQPAEAEPTEVLDDGFEGEVIYDPTFISPQPDEAPQATAMGALKGEIGPALTPPATDTITLGSGRQGGPGVPLLIGALAILTISVVALGRIPAARGR
jgi:hypothetical protein